MAVEQINGIIMEHLDLVDESEVKLGASLFDDLRMEMDELSEIIIAIEDEFDIEIPEDDVEDFEYVEDIVNYVEKSM